MHMQYNDQIQDNRSDLKQHKDHTITFLNSDDYLFYLVREFIH